MQAGRLEEDRGRLVREVLLVAPHARVEETAAARGAQRRLVSGPDHGPDRAARQPLSGQDDGLAGRLSGEPAALGVRPEPVVEVEPVPVRTHPGEPERRAVSGILDEPVAEPVLLPVPDPLGQALLLHRGVEHERLGGVRVERGVGVEGDLERQVRRHRPAQAQARGLGLEGELGGHGATLAAPQDSPSRTRRFVRVAPLADPCHGCGTRERRLVPGPCAQAAGRGRLACAQASDHTRGTPV